MTDIAECVLDETILNEVKPCDALTNGNDRCPNEGNNHVKVECIYCDRTMWRFFCDPCLDMIKNYLLFHKPCMYKGGLLILVTS